MRTGVNGVFDQLIELFPFNDIQSGNILVTEEMIKTTTVNIIIFIFQRVDFNAELFNAGRLFEFR